MPRQFLHLLFLCIALMISLLPLRVLPAQLLTSCPEPAGMSLRDDQMQEFRIEA